MNRPRAVTFGALCILGVLRSAAAQRPAERVPDTWETLSPTKYYAGTTRREQASLVATLGDIERILWKVPEIAHPTGFRVEKNAQGGGPPWHPHRRLPGFEDSRSILESSFGLMFFLPGATEGSYCIQVDVNQPQIGADAPTMLDEAGRILMVEPGIGKPNIPGATIVHGGLRWDTPAADRRSAFVTFSKGGVLPWKPVSREQFLRFWIYQAEGPDYDVNEPALRKSLEKTTYDRWREEAASRKEERDEAITQVAQLQGRAAADELRKTLEQREREVTERLKADDVEERKRHQAVLGTPSQADEYRARIAAMSPSERASPAYAPYGSTELLASDDPWARRVLTPDPEFWRVRRSRVEVKSITVAFHPHLTCGAPAVRDAVWKAYQTLDWAAIKRIVDRPW
jgi:hypothetical protein